MTTAGWIIMLGATGGMTLLLVWCICKVLRTPGSSEHLHSPSDIDTRDRNA